MKKIYAAPVTPANAFFINQITRAKQIFNSGIECQKLAFQTHYKVLT